MGGGRFSHDTWSDYAASRSYATSNTEQIFSTRRLHPDLDPRNARNGVRESRDSDDNPESTAIIIGLDVTGSMGMVLDAMARRGVPTLLTELYNRRPVSDPHIMCMGIGDAEAGDQAPLQVTQFEADIRISQQLEQIYLERGGGGNSYESYLLAHYFAAYHTAIDCFEKRGKKGYLFTIGDECPTPYLRAEDLRRVLGDEIQGRQLTLTDVLTAAAEKWNVFHIIVEEGNYARSERARVVGQWSSLLGQRAVPLADHTKVAEVIVAAIQMHEGMSMDDVVAAWSGDTTVARAVRAISLAGSL